MGKPKATDSEWATICSVASLSTSRYAAILGDAEESLRRLPPGTVNTCVTSPPYWQARDYGNPRQIGLESRVEDYVQRFVGVFDALRRVLAEDGTVWLNVGDRYLHGCGTVDGKPPEKGWKRNKQLTLVPFRLALALQEDGWWVRNVLSWHKPNAMPASVTDRLSNTWEPVLLLTKAEKYYFDLDAIRIPHTTDDEIERRRAANGRNNGKAKGQKDLRRWLNSPRHRASIDGLKEIRRRPNAPDPTILAAYLREALNRKGVTLHWVAEQLGLPFERTRHYFRTDQIGSRLPPEDTWEQLKSLLDLGPEFDEAMQVEVGDNVFRNHPKGKNPGDMVRISASGASTEHFAVMPVALAEWALKATLPPGGVCLDPFMGIGSTGIAVLRLGGRFVGIDIERRFINQFAKRLKKEEATVQTRLFD